MYGAIEFGCMILDVFSIHSGFARRPEKAFRKFDHKTPYGVHPTLAAMLYIQEENLPEEMRMRGTKALLLHDILEDTTADLPDWCTDRVRTLVEGLTFDKSQDYMTEIWNREEEVILLKFYDCVVNLLSAKSFSPERAQKRKEFVQGKFLDWMRRRYPDLDIIKIAEGLTAL